MKKIAFIGFLMAVILVGCKDDDIIDDINPEGTKYKVTFQGTWNETDHPGVPNNDHFSPVIGLTHNSNVKLFEADTNMKATDGIENMAETGGTSPLDTEIKAVITDEEGFDFILGGGLTTGTSSVTFNITVNTEYDLISLVSMIAPSSDWFVGVNSLDLYVDGAFITDTTVSAGSYDAGTEEGTAFSGNNDPTSPHENITRLTEAPFDDADKPFATFRFEKL